MPLIDLMTPLAWPGEGSVVVGATGTSRGTFTVAQLKATVVGNRQAGLAYTAVLADAGREIERDNASSMTTTIPPDSSVAWPTNAAFTVLRYGAGSLQIVGGTGVVLRHPPSRSTFVAEQYEVVSCRRLGANEWLLGGGLALA